MRDGLFAPGRSGVQLFPGDAGAEGALDDVAARTMRAMGARSVAEPMTLPRIIDPSLAETEMERAMRSPRSKRRIRNAGMPIPVALFALTGCVTRQTEMSGLRPRFPPAEYRSNIFAGTQPDHGCTITVGSLQPQIRWSPFLLPAE